jgi:hypothetical protein
MSCTNALTFPLFQDISFLKEDIYRDYKFGFYFFDVIKDENTIVIVFVILRFCNIRVPEYFNSIPKV